MRLLLAALLVLLSACGGESPSTNAPPERAQPKPAPPVVAVALDATFSSPYGLSLRLPSSWVRSAKGRVIRFTDPADGDGPGTLLIHFVGGSKKGYRAQLDAFKKRGATPRKLGKLQGYVHLAAAPIRRTALRAFLPLSGKDFVLLTLSCPAARDVRQVPLFERILASVRSEARPRSAALRFRHPLGVSFDLPDGWRITRSGRRVFCGPPALHEKKRPREFPAAVTITAAPPSLLDTLEEVQQFVKRDLIRRELGELDSVDARWAGVDGMLLSWRNAGRDVRQYVTLVHGCLITLTLTGKAGELETILKSFRIE